MRLSTGEAACRWRPLPATPHWLSVPHLTGSVYPSPPYPQCPPAPFCPTHPPTPRGMPPPPGLLAPLVMCSRMTVRGEGGGAPSLGIHDTMTA